MNQIAVLGGGIAGAAACLKLAQSGVRPVWIARREAPDDKPGESLSAAARTVLTDLGAADLLDLPVHRPANSVFSAWGADTLNERSGIVHLEGPGLVLDRSAFETALYARAKEVTDCLEMDAISCHRDGTSWNIVHTQGNTKAQVVIDATGRKAVLARDQSRRFRADQLVALVAFLKQDRNSDIDPTPATLIESVPDGWWYATLLADGRLALNYYTDSDLLPQNARRDADILNGLLTKTTYISRWINEAGFTFDQPPNLASAATTWLAPCAGDGWLAVGDAAAAFDPLSSHGMTTALWSGSRAASAAIAWCTDDQAPLRHYSEAVMRGVQEFLEARASLYGQEKRYGERPFWQRRSQVSQPV